MSKDANLCSTLPVHLTNRITVCKNSEQYIINLLQNFLPPSDRKSISDEMKKTFTFNKFKVKHKQKSCCKGRYLSARRKMHLEHLGKVDYNSKIKYSDVLPLNQLWLQYMQEMLGDQSFTSIPKDHTDSNWINVNQQLIKADYHGAKISISASRCPSLVGLAGIVIQDTKNCFRICGTDNVIRTIPKSTVTINIHLNDGIVLKTLGRQLCVRPIERTVKNFKNTKLIQL